MPENIIIGIDASRNRSGGSISHLVGILSQGRPEFDQITEIHVWSYSKLLDKLPDEKWLIKHSHNFLNKNIILQLIWQLFLFKFEFKKANCNFLYNTDASKLSSISPSITMSRDMLSYEPNEINRYKFGKARLRLELIRILQNRSFRYSEGVIFLTNHASKVIQQNCGDIKNHVIIPHGVGEIFRSSASRNVMFLSDNKLINILYISNAAPYKHQWEVVKASEMLRKNGYNVNLHLVGGGKGKAYAKLLNQIKLSDPGKEYVFLNNFLSQLELVNWLRKCDIFVFASSCENMPNTLVEAMASGIPIASSNRGPMPEVLRDAGVYFDPEKSDTIFIALKRLIDNQSLRKQVSEKAIDYAFQYSWKKCARSTWKFIIDTYNTYNKNTSKMNSNVKFQCTNCVMDQTDSSIYLDRNGVCDHCLIFKENIKPFLDNKNRNQEFFVHTIKKIKSKNNNKDFDCILGMSGGVDSSYLLHKVVVDYNLRPLVFHVDAGWNSQIAVNNIENVVEKLNLDLFTEVIDWEEMKELQLAYFKSGVPHIDVPQDHAFFATMYKFAKKYNIKYILSGGNYSTECVRNPLEWMYYQSDSFQLKDIFKKHGYGKLNNFPITNILWHKIYLPYIKGIKLIRPLDYMDYNKEQATQLLEKLYGYQRYPQKHFESRFTRFYESFWLPERFGYDTRKVQYSSLILTGQMTREEALEKLKIPSYTKEQVSEDFEFISNKLGITVDELWSYFYLPKKTFRDFKSQESIYKLGAKVMQIFGLEKGEEMIGLINYGSGNIQAISNIYNRLGIENKIISKVSDFDKTDKLILPGVGSFDETISQLTLSGIKDKLDEEVIHKKTPVLGICVGMQMMSNGSDEGQMNGLGWIKGRVKKFEKHIIIQHPYIPHMGWNRVESRLQHKLFDGIDKEFGFYFVHSYYFETSQDNNVLATSFYGTEFTSAVYADNIFGVQFHPEKSHGNGIRLLKNFAEY